MQNNRSKAAELETMLARMRSEIGNRSPLLAERLLDPVRPPAPNSPAPTAPGPEQDIPPGFSDVFTKACEGEIPSADHYLFALEYIYEGYLLHYGQSRLLDPGAMDFRLLAGDYMYAEGLRHISMLEDPVCIRMLAGLVGTCSFVHCEGLDPELALAAWSATAAGLAARASEKASAG